MLKTSQGVEENGGSIGENYQKNRHYARSTPLPAANSSTSWTIRRRNAGVLTPIKPPWRARPRLPASDQCPSAARLRSHRQDRARRPDRHGPAGTSYRQTPNGSWLLSNRPKRSLGCPWFVCGPVLRCRGRVALVYTVNAGQSALLGRADDVGKEDGRKHPVDRDWRPRASQKLLDRIRNLVGVVADERSRIWLRFYCGGETELWDRWRLPHQKSRRLSFSRTGAKRSLSCPTTSEATPGLRRGTSDRYSSNRT